MNNYTTIEIELTDGISILTVEIAGQVDGNRVYDVVAMLNGKDITDLVDTREYEARLVEEHAAVMADHAHEMERDRRMAV